MANSSILYTVLGLITAASFIYSFITIERRISIEDDKNVEVITRHVVFGKGPFTFIVGEYHLRRRIHGTLSSE